MGTWKNVRYAKLKEQMVKRQKANKNRPFSTKASLPAIYRRAKDSGGPLSLTDVRTLQHMIGNKATSYLLSERASGQSQIIQRTMDEKEDLECPGSKIQSGGRGRGLGLGLGKGPIGVPKATEWETPYEQGNNSDQEIQQDEPG